MIARGPKHAALNLVLMVCLLSMVVMPASARESGPEDVREPWRLSWEERMALRFDAAEQARRTDEHAHASEAAIDSPGLTLIDGATDPAVFVPWELFDHLIATAFAPDPRARDVWRSLYRDRLNDPPADLWLRLEEVSKTIVHLQEMRREVVQRLESAPEDQRSQLTAELPDGLTFCRARAAALQAARRELGADIFDKLLYQAVAHFLTMTSRDENPAELAWIEGGCR